MSEEYHSTHKDSRHTPPRPIPYAYNVQARAKVMRKADCFGGFEAEPVYISNLPEWSSDSSVGVNLISPL